MRLKDKIALVTGSSQGIGRAIALRFAQEGADVVINYNRTAKGAEEALAEIEAAGRRGLIVQADLGKVEDIRRLVNAAVGHFGRLDLNLKGVFFATQEMVRHLRATNRGGKIVNISSVHEELPFPNFTAYCASKGGVKMLTRTPTARRCSKIRPSYGSFHPKIE
jgi:glucose 1-dehydrogenase